MPKSIIPGRGSFKTKLRCSTVPLESSLVHQVLLNHQLSLLYSKLYTTFMIFIPTPSESRYGLIVLMLSLIHYKLACNLAMSPQSPVDSLHPLSLSTDSRSADIKKSLSIRRSGADHHAFLLIQIFCRSFCHRRYIMNTTTFIQDIYHVVQASLRFLSQLPMTQRQGCRQLKLPTNSGSTTLTQSVCRTTTSYVIGD